MNEDIKGVMEVCMPDLQAVHGAEFNRLNKRVYDIEETLETGIAEISAIKTSISFIHKRLDEREKQTEAIVKMSTSIEYMANQVKELSIDMKDVLKVLNEHDGKIGNIEKGKYDDKIQGLSDRIDGMQIEKYNKLNGYIDSVFKAIFVAIALYLLYIFSNGQIGG